MIQVDRGLLCPKCKKHRFSVVYTEPKDGYILRRRKCRVCGARVTTHEFVRQS